MNVITEGKIMVDKIEKFGNSLIQHGKLNNRIYLLKLDPEDKETITDYLDQLAKKEAYTKIFTKIQTGLLPEFILNGYVVEAYIPRFYKGAADCILASKFLSESRKVLPSKQLKKFSELLNKAGRKKENTLPDGFGLTKLNENDADRITEVFGEVFETYPFPVHDPEYIVRTMNNNAAQYFGVWKGKKLIGISTAETDYENENAEMTDFAVLPEYRGKNLAYHSLIYMEKEMKKAGIKTAYTIARLSEPGMNKTFMNAGYTYSGTLVNNTHIAGNIESMNIFYKPL
jgi:beta-lysine N6-acetyltransferase